MTITSSASVSFIRYFMVARVSQTPVRVNAKSVFDAKKVSQFAVILCVVNDEISALACFKRSYFTSAIKAVSGVNRRRR